MHDQRRGAHQAAGIVPGTARGEMGKAGMEARTPMICEYYKQCPNSDTASGTCMEDGGGDYCRTYRENKKVQQ